MFPSLVLLLASFAHSQALQADRAAFPASGIASESGPGAQWVNPANMGFDPDARSAIVYTRSLNSANGPTALSVMFGGGAVSLGAHLLTPGADSDLDPRWTLDYATSVSLPNRLTVGWRIAWHLVTGEPNYVSYDFGASWRPLPWFGLAMVGRNVANPDPTGQAATETGIGLALRPFGDALLLGVDGIRTFTLNADNTTNAQDDLAFSLRIRPIEGWYIRGFSRVTPATGAFQAGGGLEFYFGGAGGGAAVTAGGAGGPLLTAWLGTDEPGESLIRGGRHVPVLELDSTPAYQPTRTLFAPTDPSWLDTLELVRQAEEDPGVRGLVIRLGPSMSWARLQELRTRIDALERAGKPVTVYLGDFPSNGSYWVASAASEIILHPASTLNLTGLSAEMTYFRGALDMLNVEPQFVKRSEFKSGPEAQTQTGPSESSLEQMNALLDDLYAELVDGIATGRHQPPEQVAAWIDGGPWTAREALDSKMVDALLYSDELEKHLSETHDGYVRTDDLHAMPQPHSPWETQQKIAVVYIDGVIVPGWSNDGGLLGLGGKQAGARTIVEHLNRARVDGNVRATVLRVDSPGGSAFASDEIARAVERYAKAGKPIVVSMGGVAASGGYYVSAGADVIWAEPGTVTGSIGVYTGWTVTGGLLERFGVTTTTLQRGRNATIFSQNESWDDLERARMEVLVDETYDQFKQRVSVGRGLSMDEVEEVARGRIWTGRRAVDNGLVDKLGGLQEAIANARELAGIPERREVALLTYYDAPPALPLVPGAVLKIVAPNQPHLWEQKAQVSPLLSLPPATGALLTPMSHPQERLWMLDSRTLGLKQ